MRLFSGVGVVGVVLLAGASTQVACSKGLSGAEIVVHVALPAYGCPVELSAQRTPGGELLSTGSPAESEDNGVRVRLKLPGGARIREASLTVHALSARSRALPAAADAEPDVAKEFQLNGGDKGATELGGGASVRGRATVVSVDLDELRYADGRVWRPAAGASCRVEPDGFLPVAALR